MGNLEKSIEKHKKSKKSKKSKEYELESKLHKKKKKAKKNKFEKKRKHPNKIEGLKKKKSKRRHSSSSDSDQALKKVKAENENLQESSSKSMRPMTQAEYLAKQSVVRRVIDPETGRSRLIKGDGEVLEEIVSRERHLAINKMATKNDGDSFQAKFNLKGK